MKYSSILRRRARHKAWWCITLLAIAAMLVYWPLSAGRDMTGIGVANIMIGCFVAVFASGCAAECARITRMAELEELLEWERTIRPRL